VLSPVDQEKKALEKHTKPILDALNLNNADKELKVRGILAAHFKAFNAWHTENDPQIKELWNQFNDARSKLNETNANVALAKIDGVYASFKPEHEKFLSELSSVLTSAQVEAVKEIVFNSYYEQLPLWNDTLAPRS
jgi:hypothetical protein